MSDAFQRNAFQGDAFQIGAPPQGGGGNKTLTADSGSYVITGTAASLERGYILAANTGSYSITGTAASLEYGREVAANSGTYTITGTAASLELGRRLDAQAGAYSYVGQSASLEHGYILTAGAGTYSITGTDATLIKSGGNKVLTADPGAYEITGAAATLDYAQVGTPTRRGDDAGPIRRRPLIIFERVRKAIEEEQARPVRKAKKSRAAVKKVLKAAGAEELIEALPQFDEQAAQLKAELDRLLFDNLALTQANLAALMRTIADMEAALEEQEEEELEMMLLAA